MAKLALIKYSKLKAQKAGRLGRWLRLIEKAVRRESEGAPEEREEGLRLRRAMLNAGEVDVCVQAGRQAGGFCPSCPGRWLWLGTQAV